MKFLTSGKVKDVYELEHNLLLFKFSNRVSAYDVKFKDEIPKKGEVLCKFAEYWFNKLDIPNHFVERRSDTEIVVKRINMLPIECVVRGYFYGSLVSRWKDGKFSLENGVQTDLAAKLPSPIFDPTKEKQSLFVLDRVTLQNTGGQPLTNITIDYGDGDKDIIPTLKPGKTIILSPPEGNSLQFVGVTADGGIDVYKAYREPIAMPGMMGS